MISQPVTVSSGHFTFLSSAPTTFSCGKCYLALPTSAHARVLSFHNAVSNGVTMKNLAVVLSFVSMVGVAMASNFPRVDEDLRTYDKQVSQMHADFEAQPGDPKNKAWVSAKIAHMVDVDQYTRNFAKTPFQNSYSKDEEAEFWNIFHPRWISVDAKNTLDLKDLLEKYAWFSIGAFGAKTDENAWLLVQHADEDPEFQKSVLTVLATLYPKGETSPRNYAYLFDRVAASWRDETKRMPQRYGTQGMCVGPQRWEPLPIEDAEHLDERRRSVGLEPMSEYFKQVQQYCH
jgi:hypothetical protein